MPTLNGAGPFWGTEMNNAGFMGFVDKVWILLNRIFVILVIITIILTIVLAIVGYQPVKTMFTASF